MQAGRAVCVWMFLIRLPGCGHAPALACTVVMLSQSDIGTGSRPICADDLPHFRLYMLTKPSHLPFQCLKGIHAAMHWHKADCKHRFRI